MLRLLRAFVENVKKSHCNDMLDFVLPSLVKTFTRQKQRLNTVFFNVAFTLERLYQDFNLFS